MRLAPDRAAYHANRAAAALQLRNFAGAADDAQQAVRLCPTHTQARLRAAKAYMRMFKPQVLGYRECVNTLFRPEHIPVCACHPGRAEALRLHSRPRSQQ